MINVLGTEIKFIISYISDSFLLALLLGEFPGQVLIAQIYVYLL